MRKLLIAVVVLVALAFGGMKLIEVTAYGGATYYTKVTTDGARITQHDRQGHTYVDYRYRLTGYDEQGQGRALTFNANKARPLTMGAYLKLTYNQKKGVTRWAAVDQAAVPQKARTQLN
ncbi:YxeA family protein [Lacticaseibacillus jixianensis]|uniref:YxeA family protein n=1 Tax=Lacticaseibacillus jixianensis TaxID=2486012 RepID=A0ABW4BA49_9LACO|nr:YxeA family protein [Lacticaseibacillus jixianensis]